MKIPPRKRRRGFLPFLAAGVLVLTLGAAFRLYLALNTPAEDRGREVIVQIPAGSTFVAASKRLVDAGVIRSLRPFVLLGKVKGLSGSVQAGEFAFRTDMTATEVLEVLSRGRPMSYSVTVPEGFNASQIADLLEQKGLAGRGRVLELAEDGSFARSLGLPADRLEGFLFPDTYSWPKGLPAEEILRAMVRRYRGVFDETMRLRAARMGFSELQIVTLASIVEKETGVAAERKKVSAVFHNRLRKGYRLQTDPTVIYGLKDFDGNLTKDHLRKDHPYNTYTRAGLPPGPIANPGRDSLEAALYPEDAPYLYFVARGDGTHVFSRSLQEHNEAVRAFQLGEAAR